MRVVRKGRGQEGVPGCGERRERHRFIEASIIIVGVVRHVVVIVSNVFIIGVAILIVVVIIIINLIILIVIVKGSLASVAGRRSLDFGFDRWRALDPGVWTGGEQNPGR